MLTADEIKKLPKNSDTSIAEAGIDTLLYVEGPTDDTGKENWVLVGGQRNVPLKRTADTLDASCKTSGGWGTTKEGKKSWSIDYDGLLVLNDKGVDILDYCYMHNQQVHIKRANRDGSYRVGWAYVTEFDDDNAHDAIATISVTLTGAGAISEKQTDTSTVAKAD